MFNAFLYFYICMYVIYIHENQCFQVECLRTRKQGSHSSIFIPTRSKIAFLTQNKKKIGECTFTSSIPNRDYNSVSIFE